MFATMQKANLDVSHIVHVMDQQRQLLLYLSVRGTK